MPAIFASSIRPISAGTFCHRIMPITTSIDSATKPGAEPACGAAEAEVRGTSQLEVRVADIRYRIVLHSAELDVSTRHGSLQVDEFSSTYEWSKGVAGEVLRFGDEAKDVRYEIRLGARRPR